MQLNEILKRNVKKKKLPVLDIFSGYKSMASCFDLINFHDMNY